MLFLHSHGVSTGRAVRIYKTYGEQAIEKVRENPYTLAKDIHGIGFATADQIAQSVGIPKDSQNRARAGIDHVLLGATSEGHCALPLEKLKAGGCEAAGGAGGDDRAGLVANADRGFLLLEEIDGEPLIFLPHLRRAEDGIAAKIRRLATARVAYPAIDFEKAIAWCEAADRKDARAEPAGGVEDSPGQSCRHRYGRPGRGQDNPRELDSDDPASQESEVSAVRADRDGRRSVSPRPRDWRRRPFTACWRSIRPQEGSCAMRTSRWTAIFSLSMRPRWWTCCSCTRCSGPSRKTAGLILVGDVDQLPSVGPGKCTAGPDRERRGARRSPDRSVPAGGQQQDHHQRAPHPPGQDAGTSDSRVRLGLLFRRAGNAGGNSRDPGQAGPGPNPEAAQARPHPRYSGPVPDEPGIDRSARVEHGAPSVL